MSAAARPAEAQSNGTMAGAIDRAHLSRQTLGDPDLEREILALFRRQADVMLQRLRAARGDERRIAAHTLKGSARAIGAWHLAEAAEAVETAEATPDLAPLRGAVGDVNAMIELLLAS
jgi:HPt (histidine-containing phosphotransfer) domain-containing protein